jgi:hypothetical protein
MTAPLEIALTWSVIDRTLALASPAAGSRVTLDDATGQAIVERASRDARSTPVRITVTAAGSRPPTCAWSSWIRARRTRPRPSGAQRSVRDERSRGGSPPRDGGSKVADPGPRPAAASDRRGLA